MALIQGLRNRRATPAAATGAAPAASDPLAGFGGRGRGLAGLIPQDPYGKQIQGLLGGAQEAGFFNPLGSPMVREARRAAALRTADARRRRSSVLGRLYGLDPIQQRGAMMDADIGASQGAADFLNDAELEELLGQRGFLQSLLSGERGFEQQKILARMAAKAAEKQRGSPFGQILGAAVGGLPFLGGIFGGGGGGGGSDPFEGYM
jgi:hypothetical protein